MFRKIEGNLTKRYDCQTAREPDLSSCIHVNAECTEKGERGVSAVDFLQPLSWSSLGVQHILVCIDVFSKAVYLYPFMLYPTAKSVLKIVLKKYFPKHSKMK